MFVAWQAGQSIPSIDQFFDLQLHRSGFYMPVSARDQGGPVNSLNHRRRVRLTDSWILIPIRPCGDLVLACFSSMSVKRCGWMSCAPSSGLAVWEKE